MSLFRFEQLHAENFRCFETLELSFEDDLTVLFAENGGGKSALLDALAMGLAVVQRDSPKNLKLTPSRDPRLVNLDEKGRRESAGPCTVTWRAEVGPGTLVHWATSASAASGRTKRDHGPILEAIERTRAPGERWPLFAWYGTDRMSRNRARRKMRQPTADRWDGYASALDPSVDDGSLLQWFTDEILTDTVRRREVQEERFLDAAVAEAMVDSTRPSCVQ